MVFLKSKFANSADFFKKWKKPDACNFIKKETLAQVFSCEFCEVSKNNVFTEHLWTTLSEISITVLFGIKACFYL